MRLRADEPADTDAIAAALAAHLRAGDLVVLAGEMGAGKTRFAAALCRALGVTEPVTSPTFNLVHRYRFSGGEVWHVDVYRLDRSAEVEDLGLEEARDDGAIVIVEWGDVVPGMADDALVVRLTPDGPTSRWIDVDASAPRFVSRSERVRFALRDWSAP
jgi:tRNA threonylcarbamoyladenosine biosynthesis protein TsaE